MGKIIPPILQAKAIVRRVRFCVEPIMAVTSTEAATLDTIAETAIHRIEIDMWNRNQLSGDAIRRDASFRVIWYLSRTCAIRNDEMKRKMTGSKNEATAALSDVSGEPGNKPRTMESGRIRIDVTKGGIASETHRIEENINNDKQRRDARDKGVKRGMRVAATTADTRIAGDRVRARMRMN